MAPEKYTGTTIILPVLNETYSLRQTVERLERTAGPELKEYIIVVCDRTTDAARTTVEETAERLGSRCRIHEQVLPFIGGAMREAFDLATSSHTVMMSSDLETPPEVVADFIAGVRKRPDSIVTASRWIKGGGFSGYNPVKLIANFVFQRTFSMIYGAALTDMTYAYRIFPTRLLQAIAWEELKHPFFLETAIKPLRLGVKISEVPAKWEARVEGESVNPFFSNFAYFKIALRVKSYPREQLLRPGKTL